MIIKGKIQRTLDGNIGYINTVRKDTYGSSRPGWGKSWTNVTFQSKVGGCYGQRKAKIHTLSSPTI